MRFRVIDAEVDDGELAQGAVGAAGWVMALAYLKARAGWLAARRAGLLGDGAVVLGADTVCVLDGRVIGQPGDAGEAAAMIRSFVGRPHDVITGVCLIGAQGRRDVFAVRASVTLGSLEEARIARYVGSGAWRGKAGAYNYFDRLGDGWPLACDGDPTAVVGLPMRAMGPRLERLGLIGVRR